MNICFSLLNFVYFLKKCFLVFSEWFRRKSKIEDEYGLVKNLPKENTKKQVTSTSNPYGHWQGICEGV